MLALIVGGVIISMSQSANSSVRSTAGTTALPAPVTTEKKPTEPVVPVARTDASWVAETEPLARQFLKATTVEELLPLVRNPATAEPRMRTHYPDGKVVAPGLSQFNSTDGALFRKNIAVIPIRTLDYQDKNLAFVETPEGMKIDWESWVGWSDISWAKFLEAKPVSGHVFRVILSPVSYYNFDYADDAKWQSYRLLSPDRACSIYGYAEKLGAVNKQLGIDPADSEVLLTLSLKFPANAKSASQVEIERIVAEGWVEGAP